MKLQILNGQRFGMLTVVFEAEKKRIPSGQTNRNFYCKCDCGNYKEVRLVHLYRGRTVSCGCKVAVRKGEGNGALCKVWRQMKSRCEEKYFENHLYFKKGITVCGEWYNDFAAFRDWSLKNGYTKGLQIDRRDNSKGYSPDNCRWVTCKQNANNKDNTFMINYRGVNEPIMLLLERLGKLDSMSAIRTRIKRGWKHDKAVDASIRVGNYRRK